MSQDEKNIVDFWDNKHYYKTPELLKEKAREYYTEEFVNGYSKWSDNVRELNVAIKTHLQSKQFPMQHFEEMPYDWFCKNINKLIEDWITANKDIQISDISIIMEKLIADYIAICLNKYKENAYTISTLLDSIKNVVSL
jgi:hypothetical protein